MKAISKLLVAGMLAMATAMPVAHARTFVLTSAKVTITDALAYRILAGVAGDLEAQLNQSLSTDFLYSEYKAGKVIIKYLGYDGATYTFSAEYQDGLGMESLEDI